VGEVPETRGSTLDWLAPYYDSVCRIAGINWNFRAATIMQAKLRRGEKVLDVGCGTGVLTRLAAAAVGTDGAVLGIDPAPDMIRLARIAGHEARSAARFELAAIETIPAASETFDAVLLSFVIHCLPSDLKRTGLQEAWRVLKPGGRLVVVDLDRPANAAVRIVLAPFQASAFFGDHLKGLVPERLRDVGFEQVLERGRWRGIVRTWIAYKPRKANQ
jgi:ubiquinone/menaquinone biosynthesis C-methylase UbiE